MNDVELEVAKGTIRFRGRGPQAWVEEQFERIFLTLSVGQAGKTDHTADADADVGEETQNGNDAKTGRVGRWLAQQNVSQTQVDHVFHLDGDDLQLIASGIPGSNNRDKCVNVYILLGIRSLLGGQEGKFADDDARRFCEQYGLYDATNHSRVLKQLNPEVSGSKATGWMLTKPGETAAANLVKQIAGET